MLGPWWSRGLGATLALGAVAVVGATAVAGPMKTPPAAREALVAGDCHLCHVVPDVVPATREQSCADCHQWIRAVATDPGKRAVAMQTFPLWERYEKSVATYLQVPDLEAAMARLNPAWVREYLADPHDLRPHLDEGMPRLGLSEAQIEAIGHAFAGRRRMVPSKPPPDAANLARGESIFVDKGCAACHTFGARHADVGSPTAPDLQHARARMLPDLVWAWIKDPKAVAPTATMPSFGLTDDEVTAVRDYVLLADVGAKPAAPWGPVPAATTAPVTWAQVEERVFGRICVHCHMDPAQNDGRAGPGNAGGFGWPATGLALESYEQVVAAAPKLADALHRRRLEAHRDVIRPGESPADLTRPSKPGMPLGLPPLSDDDHALVLGWIAQGTPR